MHVFEWQMSHSNIIVLCTIHAKCADFIGMQHPQFINIMNCDSDNCGYPCDVQSSPVRETVGASCNCHLCILLTTVHLEGGSHVLSFVAILRTLIQGSTSSTTGIGLQSVAIHLSKAFVWVARWPASMLCNDFEWYFMFVVLR